MTLCFAWWKLALHCGSPVACGTRWRQSSCGFWIQESCWHAKLTPLPARLRKQAPQAKRDNHLLWKKTVGFVTTQIMWNHSFSHAGVLEMWVFIWFLFIRYSFLVLIQYDLWIFPIFNLFYFEGELGASRVFAKVAGRKLYRYGEWYQVQSLRHAVWDWEDE